MKIAFDAKRMLNNVTGLGNHARILVNTMMRDFPQNEYLLFSPRVQDRFLKELKGNYNVQQPDTALSRLIHPWWRSFGMTESLLANMVDVYHGLSNELPLNIHRSGIRPVVTIHDLIFLKHTEQYPWIDRQMYSYKTKYAAKYADRIIAVSEETKHDLMKMYQVPEAKITVIYQSADSSFTRPASIKAKQALKVRYKLPERYILNVSSFFPRKNQVRLIEAFALIKDQIGHDLVLVASTGDMKEKVKEAITQNKLNDRIHIIDSIDNDDMPALYQCADLFVFPSLFEGFGLPVSEALWSGVPVIATRGGAIEEAAGNGSQLIDPYDISDIADKILSVLQNESIREKMIEQGYGHARTMTDSIFAKKTMDVYGEVLSK